MKILITGGNGFVGRYLERVLHENNHTLIGVLRKRKSCSI